MGWAQLWATGTAMALGKEIESCLRAGRHAFMGLKCNLACMYQFTSPVDPFVTWRVRIIRTLCRVSRHRIWS